MIEYRCTYDTPVNGKLYRVGDRAWFGGEPPKWFEPVGGPVEFDQLPMVPGGSVTLLADGPKGRDYRVSPYPVAAVNRAGVRYRGALTYWVTLHPCHFMTWIRQRQAMDRSVDGVRFISHERIREPRVALFTDAPVQGSSSLLAFMALEAMGYDHIHLVGVDLSGPYQIFREAWNSHTPRVKVTSDDPDNPGYRRG